MLSLCKVFITVIQIGLQSQSLLHPQKAINYLYRQGIEREIHISTLELRNGTIEAT